MANGGDNYANKGFATCTESAAATLTFTEIQTNVNVFDKVAWVLHRIEWYIPYATYALFDASGDELSAALTASDKITSLDLSNPGVIDLMTMTKFLGTAVGYSYEHFPIARDFGSLPGGGLIIAPRPLFLAIKGTGNATVATAKCRFYFTAKVLKADEYLELVDFYRLVS